MTLTAELYKLISFQTVGRLMVVAKCFFECWSHTWKDDMEIKKAEVLAKLEKAKQEQIQMEENMRLAEQDELEEVMEDEPLLLM